MNILLSFKKNIVPLVFVVFLFSQLRAEFNHSAFSAYIQNNNTSNAKKQYELAKTFFEDEKYSKALEILLPLSNQLNYSLLKIKVNSLIGQIFKNTKDFKNALYFFEKTISDLSNIKMNSDIVHDTNEINLLLANNHLYRSFIYIKTQKNDSALYHLNKILDINSVNLEIMSLKGDAYSNIGIISFRKKNFADSEKHFNNAIDIYKKTGNNTSISVAISNLANIYSNKKEYQQAKELYIKALEYLKNNPSKKAIKNKQSLYFNLAWTLYNLKDYEAYDYLYQSNLIKDSITKKGIEADIKEIEARHNIDMVKQKEEEKRIKLQRNTWIIGISGLLISLILIFIATLFKLKQKNLSLQLSQQELEQQKRLDHLKNESQTKIINATIDGKESERQKIAETLHDNISAILSSANLHLLATQKQFKDGEPPAEFKKTRELILDASDKIRDLSHNLVSSLLLKFGLEYALKDIAKKFSNSNLNITTEISNIHRYSQDFEIKTFNIIQELVNNILKHSKAKNASITLEDKNDKLFIVVEDDGIGFNVNEKKNSKTSGIGLNQIDARIQMMKGELFIESKLFRGTTIKFNIPVQKRIKEQYSA